MKDDLLKVPVGAKRVERLSRLAYIRGEAGRAKSDLIRLYDTLEREGFAPEARKLERIIFALESWQNKCK